MAKNKIKNKKKTNSVTVKSAGQIVLSPTEEIKLKRTKIRVIGIGEGGSSIVSEIASRVKKASFVAANTNVKALREVRRNVLRFPFGEAFTHGLGTGMNVE
ncbi:MAG: hypothetical protein V1756_01690, partial [Patescibacteria group bacterium]